MILVLLGTQNNSFHRLLEEIQKNIEDGTIKEEVIVQKGYTKFESRNMEIYNQLPASELYELIEKAEVVITHGGVGSIIDSIKRKKKVIAIPRLKEYNEHVNNHQLDIISSFNKMGYILGIDDVKDLKGALARIREFEPKEYIQNTGNVIKIIEEFIEKNWKKRKIDYIKEEKKTFFNKIFSL